MPGEGDGSIDVLIVGAGPTGLTLAAQLSSFGVSFRIVDQAPTAAHESRALAEQARTLDILQSFGLGEALVARGNPSARLALHFDGGPAAHVQFGGFAAEDPRFLHQGTDAERLPRTCQHIVADATICWHPC